MIKKYLLGALMLLASMCAKSEVLEGEYCWLESTFRVVMQEKGGLVELDAFVPSLYDAVKAASDTKGGIKFYKIAANKGKTDVMQLYTLTEPRKYLGKVEISTSIRCKCKVHCAG